MDFFKDNKEEGDFWKIDRPKMDYPIRDNDLREVNLPVKVLFKWTDKIIDEYDYILEEVISYKSGYIMEVVPDQEFVYDGEDTRFIGSMFKEQ